MQNIKTDILEIRNPFGTHLDNSFQFLNNITSISTHFFSNMYFQKIQTTLLKQNYQMDGFFMSFFKEKNYTSALCIFLKE